MKLRIFVLVISAFSFIQTGLARDSKLMLPVSEVLSSSKAKSKLGDKIKFYFGTSKKPSVSKTFDEYSANKKTNAFNKSDVEACQIAFLSALISLKKRAEKLGANAVINIKSNYKNNVVDDSNNFECGAGNLIAGSALLGTPAILK